MTMRRRDALKTLGGLAGAAGMARFLPGCGSGDDGPVGITTYVYLMLENRTYDHVLGGRALEGLGGDGLTAALANPDASGTLVKPYVPNTSLELCTIADPPHGWGASHAQWNNGAMDGFLTEFQKHAPGATDAMQYLTRAQQPVTWALADAYTTCDRWFASVMGPTLPNRAYWHAATSWGLNDNNGVLDRAAGGIPSPSIYNRLAAAGIDWAYYYGNLAVVSVLNNPGPHQLDLGPNDGTGHVRRFGDALQGGGQFFKDAAAGKLPPVVYIDPAFDENDDHPPSHPILGQELIAAVYTALATSPQWKNCMLVVTYDEHGGFFDHVPPPTTTDDTNAVYGVDGFEQLGFRVPTLVAGPYVKQNYVSSVTYDHTSALKQLGTHFGLEPLNPRMAAANDLMDCIDLDRLAAGEPAPPIELPVVDRTAHPIHDQRCIGAGGFRKGPLAEWVDAGPDRIAKEYDLRAESRGQLTVYEYLRAAQRGR